MTETLDWETDFTGRIPVTMMHPGVSDQELAGSARTVAGQLELVFGCDVFEGAREAVESALLTCRDELRRAIAGAREDAHRVTDHGVDTVAELRAIEAGDDADRAEYEAEERERVATAIERLSTSLRPGTTHTELVAMVRAAEALNGGRLPGLFDALTAERDRLAAAVDMLRPLIPAGAPIGQVRALVSAAVTFGGRSLPGVSEALLGAVTPWSPRGWIGLPGNPARGLG